MRSAFPAFLAAVPLVVAVAACQVSKDESNGAVTVSYNQDVAENAASDIANTATTVADKVGNEIDKGAEKIDNKVDVNGNGVTIKRDQD